MIETPKAKLYSPELLALATGLARFPLDPALTVRAEARSRTCGSVIMLGLALGKGGQIAQIGMQVSACVIGQASAMLLAQNAAGADALAITRTTAALEQWVAGEAELPRWPDLDVLTPARAHPGRHGALLLPWTAACMALSQGADGG